MASIGVIPYTRERYEISKFNDDVIRVFLYSNALTLWVIQIYSLIWYVLASMKVYLSSRIIWMFFWAIIGFRLLTNLLRFISLT